MSDTRTKGTSIDVRADDPSREPWLSTLLRTLVYVVTAAVLAFPLAVPSGVFGALLGAGLGAIAGRLLAGTAARLHVIVLVSLASFGLAYLLADAFVASDAIADAIGPSWTLSLGDFLAFFGIVASVATALRAASVRHRVVAIVEAAVVALAFASLVVSHRNGAIHRPYAIADPILERGGDPTVAILVIGAMAAVVIGLLLLSEKSLLRSVVHVALVFAMLLLVLFTTHVAGLPPPPPSGDGLSLRDDTSQGGGGGGQGGQGNQQGGPDFQDEYDQSGAQTPVAVILLHDDYSPPGGTYYFRQDAFSRYNGRRLVGAQQRGIDEDVAPGYPSRSTPIPDSPETGAFRTTVETTVGMLADHPRPFGLESPIVFFPATNPDPARFRRVFRVRSASLTSDEWSLVGRRAGSPLWSPETIAHYTHGPDDPRYRALAEQIVAELPEEYREDPFAKALSITQWLGEHGTYSLRSRHAGATDPTADFLFGDVTGYCVHFAHATVFLMRSIGLPARVATGYLSSESGRRGGSAILLSGQNSHAWPEVYLEGVGWVVVDVMPERALDPPPGTPDEELQQLLAELLRGNRIIPDDGSEPPTPINEIARDLRTVGGRIVLSLLTLLFVLLYATKNWRYFAPMFATRQSAARLYLRSALDRLAEGGLVREDGESREAFAERMRARIPSLTPLSRWAEASKYGGKLPPDALSRVRGAYGAFERERARTVPWWRRALGLIDPFSWLRVK
ncbi:MAG: transglutaminase domain-containing protein [Deltaproteobacteria bacterium]|nr:transglutaminase domain-containing protein [Deltaproteobacteria bacterium]